MSKPGTWTLESLESSLVSCSVIPISTNLTLGVAIGASGINKHVYETEAPAPRSKTPKNNSSASRQMLNQGQYTATNDGGNLAPP